MDFLNPAELRQRMYIWNNCMLFIGKAIDTGIHKHHAVQILIGLHNTFRLKFNDAWKDYRAVIIDKDQSHQLDGQDDWQLLILVDSDTEECRQIRHNLLANSKLHEFDYEPGQIALWLLKLLDKKTASPPVKEVFNEIIQNILPRQNKLSPVEPRIQEVISLIHRFPEKEVSVGFLASSIYLSESRLIHLFKEQVGIPIRSYILWLRITEAIKLIVQGTPFTTAAHQTGFTDSAHLCRVFKQMFGMKLSDLFKNSRYIQLFILRD